MSLENYFLIAGILLILSYGVYLIFFWWAYRVWKKGNRRRSGIMLAAILGLAFGVPAADQVKDSYDGRALKTAEIRPETVDFEQKRILLISRVCGDWCRMMLRLTGSKVVRVHPTDAEFEAFAQTNQFPLGTKTVRTELKPGSPFQDVETPVGLPDLAEFDLVVVHGERPDWTRHFNRLLPTAVSYENTLLWRFVAKPDPSKPFADLEPEILVMIQRDETYQFPFHPVIRKRIRNFDFREFDDYMKSLYCGSDYARQASAYCRKLEGATS